MLFRSDNQDNKLFVGDFPQFYIDVTGDYGYTTKLKAHEWNKLGINDTNADFEEVE